MNQDQKQSLDRIKATHFYHSDLDMISMPCLTSDIQVLIDLLDEQDVKLTAIGENLGELRERLEPESKNASRCLTLIDPLLLLLDSQE